MKKEVVHHRLLRGKTIYFIGIVILATAAAMVPNHLVQSRSLATSHPSIQGDSPKSAEWDAARSSSQRNPQSFINSMASTPKLTSELALGSRWVLPHPILPMFSAPGVTTYAADCATPKTDFDLGDTVCVKATGVPLTIFNWWVSWVDPSGFIRQRDMAVANDNTTYTYQLPSSTTSVVNGQTVDNRGRWRVSLTRFNGAIQSIAQFTAHESANPSADVFVQKFQSNPNAAIHPGDMIPFTIVVGNLGPDNSAAVQLLDSAPAGSTISSFMQNLGPQCLPPSQDSPPPLPCTIASMANGDRAEFTVIYTIGGSAAPGTYTTSATVSATTPDPNSDNNTSTAQFGVQSGGGGGSCTLACPSDITAQANTTDSGGNRGAIVHFDSPTTQGSTCGSIRVDHCNDCFFPVGTTTVTATADSGDACSFDVVISEVTIVCPANKEVDSADTSCAATVDPGNPTTTGDNVTVSGSRSDGQPLSDPYPVGTTTITWTATARDGNGNVIGTASCDQAITVRDKTAPVITCPSNISVTAPTGSCSVTVDVLASPAIATDNCEGSVVPVPSRSDNKPITDPFPVGTVTITWTATDSSGNSSYCIQTVIVADNEPPAITCPSDVTVNTDPGMCSAAHVSHGTATGSDNCTPVTISGSRSDGAGLDDSYPKGTTTITWTATDPSGNHASCTQRITVVDNEPPQISCPANIVVYLPLNTPNTSTVVNYATPVGNDNCPGATTTQVSGLPSGALFPVGSTTNTFRVTDASGNYTECSFTVTVLYDFTGFFSPVGNPPTLNVVNAGRAIPVKFSLSGNKGLNIFAANSPQSGVIPCDASAPAVNLTDTVTAGGSSLSYDAASDQYNYVWKTDSSWGGTCRQLVVTLNDGSVHVANFKFR